MSKKTEFHQDQSGCAGSPVKDQISHPLNIISRRSALGGLGMIGASSFLLNAPDAYSSEPEEDTLIQQTASEHARPKSHPKEVFDLPRWVPEKTGNFDLSSTHDNFFAFAKAQANLAGTYSWFAQYGWILICPPGKPAYPFLGRMKLGKLFFTPPDPSWDVDFGEHDYTVWGTFTTTHFDPRDFSPVAKIRNPYTGKMIEPPTLHYADRIVFRMGQSYAVPGFNPDFYTQQWDRDSDFSQHYIDSDDEITYTFLGSSQFDGPHQPRCDVGFWTVKTDELMDPNLRAIDTRRDYSVIQKMTEYKWYGAPEGDPTQLFVHLTGNKTENVSRIPGVVKRGILDRFAERFET